MRRTDGATARLRDRPQAGDAPRDRHAHGAALLALHADRVLRHPWSTADEHGGDELDELRRVDGAAAKLEVDVHVVGDRRARGERVDEPGRCVDRRQKVVDAAPVAQGLDAAGRRAGAEGDEDAALGTDLVDTLDILGGGDRALDEAEVVRPGHRAGAGLEEVVDLHVLGQFEEPVRGVEQLQLAAVARGELEDRDPRFPAGDVGRRVRGRHRSGRRPGARAGIVRGHGVRHGVRHGVGDGDAAATLAGRLGSRSRGRFYADEPTRAAQHRASVPAPAVRSSSNVAPLA